MGVSLGSGDRIFPFPPPGGEGWDGGFFPERPSTLILLPKRGGIVFVVNLWDSTLEEV